MGEALTYGEDNEENYQDTDGDAMELAGTSEVVPELSEGAHKIGDEDEIMEVSRAGTIHTFIRYNCIY